MNEQEAYAVAQEVEACFPGVFTYVVHEQYTYGGKDYDYWNVWASRERKEQWWQCKPVMNVPSNLDYLRKQIFILTGQTF